MIKKERASNSVILSREELEKRLPVSEELWENCKGQCGYTPWCRECREEKERLIEETLNREGRPVDKKE